MNSNLLSTALAVTVLISGPALAQEQKAKPAGDASPIMVVETPTFLSQTMSSNQFEIRSSQLAGEKSDDGDIKELADMIVADHTKAGEKLKATLESKGSAPPADAPLAPKHARMVSQLEAASGAEFDTLYLDMQAQAHMEAVALFRTYAGSGDDQSLVGFARETLPRLETHLAHVKEIVAAK
jgi:putative membrane protein